MDLDDHVCLCFRISKRKLLNYLRTQQPVVASQLSQCGGAGTGCGWCVPFLKKLYEQRELDVDVEAYANQRGQYRETGERPNETTES